VKIRFLSPASLELDEAIGFYDHQVPGLGFRFFQEVEAQLTELDLLASPTYSYIPGPRLLYRAFSRS
jgi:hypothetical protein